MQRSLALFAVAAVACSTEPEGSSTPLQLARYRTVDLGISTHAACRPEAPAFDPTPMFALAPRPDGTIELRFCDASGHDCTATDDAPRMRSAPAGGYAGQRLTTHLTPSFCQLTLETIVVHQLHAGAIEVVRAHGTLNVEPDARCDATNAPETADCVDLVRQGEYLGPLEP